MADGSCGWLVGATRPEHLCAPAHTAPLRRPAAPRARAGRRPTRRHRDPRGRRSPSPYSSGRSTNAVRSPAPRAPSRSHGWAATEHELGGLDTEQARRGQVGLGRGLVGARELGREDAVEAQVAMAREVDEQRHVTVGEHRHRPLARNACKPARTSGHGSSRCHVATRRWRCSKESSRSRSPRRSSSVAQVQVVEVAPRARALVDLGEDRPIARTPRVGQLVGIARHPARPERVGDSRAPVDEGPEDVEGQRPDRHGGSLSRSDRAVWLTRTSGCAASGRAGGGRGRGSWRRRLEEKRCLSMFASYDISS